MMSDTYLEATVAIWGPVDMPIDAETARAWEPVSWNELKLAIKELLEDESLVETPRRRLGGGQGDAGATTRASQSQDG